MGIPDLAVRRLRTARPPLLGEVGRVVPIHNWPLLVVVSTAVIMALLSVVVFKMALSFGLATPAAVVAALVPVLLPGFGYEVLGAMTNLQWPLAYTLAWVLIVPPERSNRVAAVLVGFFAVAGGSVCAFICPLIFLHGRRWYRHPALPGMLVGAIYQLVVQIAPNVSLVVNRHPRLLPSTVRTMATFTGRALLDSGGGALRSTVWSYVGIVGAIVIGAIVATSRRRRAGLALLASATASVVVLSIANGFTTSRYGNSQPR